MKQWTRQMVKEAIIEYRKKKNSWPYSSYCRNRFHMDDEQIVDIKHEILADEREAEFDALPFITGMQVEWNAKKNIYVISINVKTGDNTDEMTRRFSCKKQDLFDAIAQLKSIMESEERNPKLPTLDEYKDNIEIDYEAALSGYTIDCNGEPFGVSIEEEAISSLEECFK